MERSGVFIFSFESYIFEYLSVGQKGTLSYIPALLIKQDWTTKTMQIIEDK